ncbi:MAG: hypothetical protein ACM33T_06420 [Solirubrobacterales bacterium]
MKRRTLALAALLALTSPARADDQRQMVTMPAPMQEHMLASMRDHLATLGEILSALAAERFDDAAKVAESRLGMSSYGLHGAAHMAPYMPDGMKQAGNALHHAASRFALAAQEVDLDRSYSGMRRLTAALDEMTAACNACHAGYRIR